VKVIGFIVLFVSACVAGLILVEQLTMLYQDSTYGSCAPPEYGRLAEVQDKKYEDSHFEVTESLEEVQSFYDRALAPTPQSPFVPGHWLKESLESGRILYYCTSPYGTLSIVTGCIFLEEIDNGTLIQTIRSFGESTVGCDSARRSKVID
jgi:hypothetical protein